MPYWDDARCGSCTPAAAQASIVRPEQSTPDRLAPPHTYGTPRYEYAVWTAVWAAELAGPTLIGVRVGLRLGSCTGGGLSSAARSCTVDLARSVSIWVGRRGEAAG